MYQDIRTQKSDYLTRLSTGVKVVVVVVVVTGLAALAGCAPIRTSDTGQYGKRLHNNGRTQCDYERFSATVNEAVRSWSDLP